MFTFILFIILALIFSYFSTQNTQNVSVNLPGVSLSQIPLYIILGVTLLFGLVFSWIVSLFDSLASALKIQGKENKIKDAKHTIQDMTRRVNELEIENAKLRGKLDKEKSTPSL